tara:strand:- start:2288 stop:2680 length:393 start_codon:yes stop_codon:yes gene_type:complete
MLATLKIAVAAAGLFVLGGNTGDQNMSWADQVSSRLENAVSFDADQLGPQIHGTTKLSFRIGEDGKATDIRVVRSSGNEWLDRRAGGKLRMIGQLPEAPASIRHRTLYAEITQGAAPRYSAHVSGAAILQ